MLVAGTGMWSSCHDHETTNKKACGIDLEKPKASDEVDGVNLRIVASTASVCDKSPTKHEVTIWIEQLKGETWEPVTNPKGETWARCTAIPAPGKKATCRYWVRCLNGTYRTKAFVAGRSPDDIPFEYKEAPRPEAKITKCPN